MSNKNFQNRSANSLPVTACRELRFRARGPPFSSWYGENEGQVAGPSNRLKLQTTICVIPGALPSRLPSPYVWCSLRTGRGVRRRHSVKSAQMRRSVRSGGNVTQSATPTCVASLAFQFRSLPPVLAHAMDRGGVCARRYRSAVGSRSVETQPRGSNHCLTIMLRSAHAPMELRRPIPYAR